MLYRILFLALVLTACNSKQTKQQTSASNDLMFRKATIEEVVQASSYTYLQIKENDQLNWAAVSKDEFKVGDEIFYFQAKVSTMQNFHSKELDRDFETILFIDQVSKDNAQVDLMNPHGATKAKAHSGRKIADASNEIDIEPIEGTTTIAELFANKAKYGNQKVKVGGVIVKVNNEIMGRNWVHLQDGTKHNGEYDLTITTKEVLNVGETAVLEGTVTLDKDFTSGYFYPVIIEDAVSVK